MKQNKIPRNEYIRKPVGKTNPYKEDTIYTDMGQWKYPGQVTKIPSGDITMQGVPYPVYGQDNLGYSQMMYPGMDYQFPGQYVTEIPMAAYGGDPSLPNIEGHYKTGGWLDQYQTRGEVKPKTRTDVYTDKALFNKAYKAEMDSANAYNSDKKWERFLKNTPDNVYTYDQLYNLYETQRKKGTAGWKLHVKTPTGSPKVDLERYIYTTDGKDLAGYSPVYKKPVVHNVYQEPEVITPDYLPMIQTGMPDIISREPEIIASPTPRPSSTNNRISWRMDPETRKMIPVYLEGKTQKVKEGKRLYNKNIPSSTAAIPADFVPQFEPDGNKDVVSKQMGGWLDAYDDEYRRGGQRRRRGTSKNIESSINDIFRRNYDVFGPAGKSRFNPRARYAPGGTTPIVTNNPKDPRLKAYKDSLALYDLSQKAKKIFDVDPMDPTLEGYNKKADALASKSKIKPTRLQLIGYSEPYKKDFDPYSMQEAWMVTYKKPVQPYKYKKEETKKEVIPEPVVQAKKEEPIKQEVKTQIKEVAPKAKAAEPKNYSKRSWEFTPDSKVLIYKDAGGKEIGRETYSYDNKLISKKGQFKTGGWLDKYNNF